MASDLTDSMYSNARLELPCLVTVDGSLEEGAVCTTLFNTVHVNINNAVAAEVEVIIDLVGITNPTASTTSRTINLWVMESNTSIANYQ